jgi:hypothetical protein
LTLTAGVFDSAVPKVTLTFDRAIDISGFDGAAIFVNDVSETGLLYDGSGGAVLAGAEVVDVFLAEAGTPSGGGIRLTATAANGIVAAGSPGPPGAWPGVTDFELSTP